MGHAGIADEHDFVPATQPRRQAWEHRLWERVMGTEFRASGPLIDPLRHVPANERLREPFKASWKDAPRTCAPTSRPSARQLHYGRRTNRGAETTCHGPFIGLRASYVQCSVNLGTALVVTPTSEAVNSHCRLLTPPATPIWSRIGRMR